MIHTFMTQQNRSHATWKYRPLTPSPQHGDGTAA